MRKTVRQNKQDCTGCQACALVCPRHAISMAEDEEGFLYPRVDPSACVGCDLCEKNCPSGKKLFQNSPRAFGAKNRDDSERQSASSGGVFSVLADRTLEAGGVVFGAVFDEKLHVEHVGAITREEIGPMKGSKYVQSDAGEGLLRAGQLIRQGMPVLFSGTPCQIAGLYASLGLSRPDNLLTVDFICHGVPSPGVFRSYLQKMEKESRQKIVSYSFRDKRLGWKNFSATAAFEDGSVHTGTQTEEPFLLGFLRNLYLRPSCHACGLRYGSHAADITLADLWGVGNLSGVLDDDKGLSLVFANTERGQKALEACENLDSFEIGDIQPLAKANPSIFSPAAANEKRAAFFRMFRRHGFREKDIRRLLFPGKAGRILSRLRRAPRALARRLARKPK